MLLWLLDHLGELLGRSLDLTGFDKITLRAALAAVAAFLVAVLLGPAWIGWLRRHFRERIDSASPEVARLHQAKENTPTMGGLFIVAGIAASGLLLGDLGNPFLLAGLALTLGLALVGIWDDLIKLRGRGRGLSARAKLFGQVAATALPAVILYSALSAVPGGCDFRLPLVGAVGPLGGVFIFWAMLVLIAVSNAVNLTDGLDGLAGGCYLFAAAGALALVYAAGHAGWAAYLCVPRIAGAGETTILAAAAIGGVLGFLWFNCHPAQVFMGDTGSLPLGGLLGLLALAARQEWLLLLLGGVFFAESLSVIVQVLHYRWRGRRVFLCAPLHHHFQFQGVPEGKIVVRFWIASALCALLSIAAVRVGGGDEARVASQSPGGDPVATVIDPSASTGAVEMADARGDTAAQLRAPTARDEVRR